MKILVQELSSPGCHICMDFEKFWGSIASDWPDVNYQKLDVTTPEGQEMASRYMIMSSPGIVINNELFSMGGFNREKFVLKLKELTAT